MSHGQAILDIIGASTTLIEESLFWDFIRADYHTPLGEITGYYLYLKTKCPLKEGRQENIYLWNKLSSSSGYSIIVSPGNEFAKKMQTVLKTFRGKEIKTSREMLIDHYANSLRFIDLTQPKYYIEPRIELEGGQIVPNGTEYLAKWMMGQISQLHSFRIAVLIADGGVGKTTVSRALCCRMRAMDSTTVPLLIESGQWRNMINANMLFENVYDAAIAERFENPTRLIHNNAAKSILSREGIIKVVFDGFDELCSLPNSGMTPKEIYQEVANLVKTEGQDGEGILPSRVLITSRETYWEENISEFMDSDIVIFRLKGFSNDQRQQYFKKRLSNAENRDKASRIASEISGKVLPNYQSIGINEDKLTGTPFILDLIARHIENGGDSVSPVYETDPLEKFLIDVCRRENERQNLGIDSEKQFQMFEELFSEYSDKFTIDDLSIYLDILCGKNSRKTAEIFSNHPFIDRIPGLDGTFMPRYEALKIYFIARYLAYGVGDKNRKVSSKILSQIFAQYGSANSPVLEQVAKMLRKLSDSELTSALKYAIELVHTLKDRNTISEAQKGIYSVASMMLPSDKSIRLEKLIEILGDESKNKQRAITDFTFGGLIQSFVFENIEFRNCEFVNITFKNCRFLDSVTFRGCRWDGTLDMINCELPIYPNQIDPYFSKEAEYSWSTITNNKLNDAAKISLAEDVLRRVLKRLVRDNGTISIKYIDRRGGLKPGNPFNDLIWDVLEKRGLIERHKISGVSEGGLHVINDSMVIAEIRSYLDNALIGKHLRAILDDIVNSI